MAESLVRVEIQGVRDLQKALRQISKEAVKELSEGLAEVTQVVLNEARPLVDRGKTGNAQASMKVKKNQRGAQLAVGGTKAPYFQWLEWGGRTGINKSVSRPFIPEGRSIYPTLRKKSPLLRKMTDELMKKLIEKHGLETRG